WSRNLLAPLVALTVLLLVVVGTAFGVIPGLPHPTNQILGKWQAVGREADAVGLQLADPSGDGPLRFVRGGEARGGKTLEGAPRRAVLHIPWVYHWTGPDTLRMTLARSTFDSAANISTFEVEEVDYRVAVGRKELTLLRTRDGKVVRYRRVE